MQAANASGINAHKACNTLFPESWVAHAPNSMQQQWAQCKPASVCVCVCVCALLVSEPVDMRRLKDKGRTFREAFLAKLALLLRGTVAAPPERFGETLADEHIRGGAPMQFHCNHIPG